MMRGFCPRGFCPEGAYVLMELCMEGVLSKGVLSKGFFVRRGFCPTFVFLTFKINKGHFKFLNASYLYLIQKPYQPAQKSSDY